MRKITLLLVMLIAIQICYSNNNEYKVRNVEVTYIANEGFLIKVGDKKILIDALFGDKDYGFCDIPKEETMNSILKNENIFKNIDLIATTHAHVDHFYSPFVIEHLMSNTKGQFISCKQSIDNLKKQDKYDKVKNRLFEITPDNFSYKDTTINGIGIRVYRLAHGPYFTDDPKTGEKINRHQNVQNIGFLFNIDGVKIFHSGDSNEDGIAEYEHFRLDKENIDIAFLGRGFIWKSNCNGIELVKNYINAKHIVLMHIHHDEFNKYNEVATQLKNEFANIKIFREELETKNYVFE
ncbi:MAG: MBL fold metallo-hydrolase [Ignavibacteriales bacterium]|nr:MBL fold metallo-hydrolase [Ignavibacteriales bacterium]